MEISNSVYDFVQMKDIETTVKERKKQMKKTVELLDGIIADGAICDTHLRMLVDEIVIYEKTESWIFK